MKDAPDAETAEHVRHQVEPPDRDAARRHDDVGRGERGGEGVGERVAVVGRVGERHVGEPVEAERRPQRVPVRLPDLVREDEPGHGYEFVAGRDDCAARADRHRHP